MIAAVEIGVRLAPVAHDALKPEILEFHEFEVQKNAPKYALPSNEGS